MSSAGVAMNSSKDYWKGSDYIEQKLGSVLDKKVQASTKQVLLDRIHFKEESKPDPFYTELKSHYKPLNAPLDRKQTQHSTTNGKKAPDGGSNTMKDELPSPKCILFDRNKISLQWKSMRKVGPGLFNLGNTCFLNSVIQVLTYTPPLVNYLSTQDHSRNCKSVGFCMLCELQRHVLRTFSHNQNEAIKPMAIIQKLKHIAKHLRFGHQEDSHEFLCYVIDGMLKSCLAGVPEKLDKYTKGTTMIHHVFGGYFRSQVTCERCHHTSSTYDPLMEILLDIKQAHSVYKALQRLTSVELLNGDNMYLCQRCKKKVPAKKHLTIHRPPNVITMCLKRFDGHSLFAAKINKEVVYPEHLNLRPFMSKNQGPSVNYKLYAVLVHSGYSCNSGHYFCFVKASNNAWYQMNDASVRQVGLKTALSQQAYLLFYIRETPTQTHKQKPHHTETVQQTHVPTQSTNGMNSAWKPEHAYHKNLPKVVTEDKKTALSKSVIGEPVARKPELHVARPTVTTATHKHIFNPTNLPNAREKISFSLKPGPVLHKKDNTPPTPVEEKKASGITAEGTASSGANAQDDLADVQQSIVEEQSQVEHGALSQDKDGEGDAVENVAQVENVVKEDEIAKGVKEENEPKEGQTLSDIHATTKWRVTSTFIGPLPPGVGGPKERTMSVGSDVSSTSCSIASKTGEWSVTDRSSTQEIGPKLPERQHAGWVVSSSMEESKEKKLESEEKSEETSANTKEDEMSREKSKKRKHAKEKREKTKFRKTDDGTRLLSNDSREVSESEEVREKRRKKKKTKKMKKAKSGSESEKDNLECESHIKSHKRSKKRKKKKRRSRSGSETDGKDSDSGLELNSGKTLVRKVVDKASEVVNKVSKLSRSEVCEAQRPLVQYSDHSSSSDNEKDVKTMQDREGSSKGSNGKKMDNKGSSSGNEGERRDLTSSSFEGDVRKRRDHNGSSSEGYSRKSRDNKGSSSEGHVEKSRDLKGSSSERNARDPGMNNKGSSVEEDSRKSRDNKGYSSEGHARTKRDSKGSSSSSNERDSDKYRDSRGSSRSSVEHERRDRDIGKSSSDRDHVSSNRSRDDRDRRHVVDMLLDKSRGSTNYGCQVDRWDGEERSAVRASSHLEGSFKRRRDEWDEEYDRGKVKRAKQKENALNRTYPGYNQFQKEYDRKRMRHDGWHVSPSSFRWRSSDRYSRRDRR